MQISTRTGVVQAMDISFRYPAPIGAFTPSSVAPGPVDSINHVYSFRLWLPHSVANGQQGLGQQGLGQQRAWAHFIGAMLAVVPDDRADRKVRARAIRDPLLR